MTTSATSAPGNIAHLRILTINDLHGQLGDSENKAEGVEIGSAATLSAYAQQARAANPSGTVLVSAGDAIGASPPASTLLNHKPTFATMAAMGVDFATLGNHEFDGGFAEAMRLIYGDGPMADAAAAAQGVAAKKRKRGAIAWPGSSFPWISANIVDKKTRATVLPPYAIKVMNGVKVAFVGADTADLKNVTSPKGIPNIDVTDPAKAVNALVPKLKAQGVQAIILLVHEGGAPDKQDPKKLTGAIVPLVEALDPAINAVVSAHSHKEYVTEINGRTVIQAGSYGAALGEINLAVDKVTGKVTTTSARLIRNDEAGILPDTAVLNMVKAFEDKVSARTSKVVTKLPAELTNTRTANGESTLGVVIADAQRAFAKADVGLMNMGGVRTSVKPGPVTWGQLFAVQPFGNRVQRFELTGEELRAVLEEQFTDKRANVLQTSGLTIHLDLTKPIGSRVVSVTMADGSPLDPTKTYKVAANAFLADGGDAFTKLKAGKNRVEVGDDLEALVAHLAANGATVPTTAPARTIIDAGALPADMK